LTRFSWTQHIALRISLKKPFRHVEDQDIEGKKKGGSEGMKEQTWIEELLNMGGPIMLRYYQDRGGNGSGSGGVPYDN
jgi:hypothetical protein